jgi:hypothetical protein
LAKRFAAYFKSHAASRLIGRFTETIIKKITLPIWACQ